MLHNMAGSDPSFSERGERLWMTDQYLHILFHVLWTFYLLLLLSWCRRSHQLFFSVQLISFTDIVKIPPRSRQPCSLHASVFRVVFNFGLLHLLGNFTGLLEVTASEVANLIPLKEGVILQINFKRVFQVMLKIVEVHFWVALIYRLTCEGDSFL